MTARLSLPLRATALGIALVSAAVPPGSAAAQTAATADLVWVDPALSTTVRPRQWVVAWFDDQFLRDGAAFARRSQEFEGRKRSELRTEIVQSLKSASRRSLQTAQPALDAFERDGRLQDCKAIWVVNAVICQLGTEGLDALRKVPGVRAVFRRPSGNAPTPPANGPAFSAADKEAEPFQADNLQTGWSVAAIGAPTVWTELGITGKGVLVAVSDFGFVLNDGVSEGTMYRNPGETPGNGIDDDGNGYVDDYHGYNFDAGTADLNRARPNPRNAVHGNMTASVIAGRSTRDSATVQVGIAPDARWAPLIGAREFEEAVQWALEMGVDIFSMSFSQPGLGEYRSHWRKVMEAGALAGIYFVSGAGNFANSTRPNYAPIPVQMRIPEDIPGAVFGVAGIDQNGERPVFSSQGPVEWMTEHYREGRVPKPDLATYNFQIPAPDVEGRLVSPGASGNSFAGPHLAGVLALMLEANPELLPWDAKAILERTAQDLFLPGPDSQSGAGLVRAVPAVKEVLRLQRGG